MKLFHKSMIRKAAWASLAFATFTLSSCSDEITNPFNTPLDDDQMEINFAVPEATQVKVRATQDDEDAVKDVTLFFFDSEGNTVIDPVTPSTITGKTVTVRISASQRKNVKTVYAVANGSKISGLADITTLNALKATATNADIILTDGLLMTGTSGQISSPSITISLKRVAAALKVEQTAGSSSEYRVTAFEVYNGATHGNIDAPNVSGNAIFNTTGLDKTIAGTPGNASYLYPVQGYGNSDNGAFVIITATYTPEGSDKSQTTYYRLNIRKEPEGTNDVSKAKEFVNILPNNYYTLTINSINGFGHTTKKDAIAHINGDDNVDYDIHDHMLNVLSMTSDGVRELGMTHDFEWDGQGVKYISVKWYCREEPEEEPYKDIEDPFIVQGSGWLVLDTDSDKDVDYSNYDKNFPQGITKKYKLTSKKDGTYREGIIRVSWRGLTREVKIVKGNASADLSDVCNASLKIFEGETSKETIENYWEFLSGKSTADKLYGVSYSSMGEKTRDEGFHFAMPYGESYNYEYVYTITFPTSTYTKITKVELASVDGDFSEADIDWKWNSSSNSGTLKMKPLAESDRFSYMVGKIGLKVTCNENPPELSVNVYHTGFFHKDSKSNTDNTSGTTTIEGAGYYYYEVVEMEGMYWLDRNLGASAAGTYIETADGNASLKENDDPANYWMKNSRGEFYNVAKSPAQGTYTNPTMYDNEVCPPGYRVPWKSEFDKLRLSTKFKQISSTRGGVSHYTSYYETNTKAGNIYFPKSRFYNNDEKSGDSQAGYYITRTSSSGLEKDQIGHWLYTLYLNGTSSSYVNGDVDGFKLNVRCVKGTKSDADKSPESLNTISFRVKGATHVYLYDKTTRSALFTFPGKAVGSIDAIDNEFIFSYNSSQNYGNLLVLFAKVEANGKISLFHTEENVEGTNPANSFKIYEETGVNVSDYLDYGWQVEKGRLYDLTTGLTEAEKQFRNGDIIEITWPNRLNNGNCSYIYIWDGKWKANNKGFPGIEATASGNNYTTTITYGGTQKKEVNYILSNGSSGNGNQTGDLKFSIDNCELKDLDSSIRTWKVTLSGQ